MAIYNMIWQNKYFSTLLKDDNKIVKGLDIIPYLQSKGYDLDAEHDKMLQSKIYAFRNMVLKLKESSLMMPLNSLFEQKSTRFLLSTNKPTCLGKGKKQFSKKTSNKLSILLNIL